MLFFYIDIISYSLFIVISSILIFIVGCYSSILIYSPHLVQGIGRCCQSQDFFWKIFVLKFAHSQKMTTTTTTRNLLKEAVISTFVSGATATVPVALLKHWMPLPDKSICIPNMYLYCITSIVFVFQIFVVQVFVWYYKYCMCIPNICIASICIVSICIAIWFCANLKYWNLRPQWKRNYIFVELKLYIYWSNIIYLLTQHDIFVV